MTPATLAQPFPERHGFGLAGAAGLTLAVALLSLGVGAVEIGPGETVAALLSLLGLPVTVDPQLVAVIAGLRLPRLGLELLVGGSLAFAGALMQGVLRNPLADPGLVGASGGAALAAVATIVLGAAWLPAALAPYAVALMAFAGALAATGLTMRLARIEGRVAVTALLLAGIAINAMAMAGVGLFIFASDDRQIRDISFWLLGSVAGATPEKVLALGLFAAVAALAAPMLARGLDAMILGEREAATLGVRVEALKRAAIVLSALVVGAAVSVSGAIGFLGLVGPHLARLLLGPLHRRLLPGAALLGAALCVGADMVARVVVQPAELPIGVVTSLIGAPLFLGLLAARRRSAT